VLTHLSISNYAIIEKLEVDFEKGLTIITGETGSGKSILLGALSLILGQRVDTSVLNNKTKKCIVEGSFKASKSELMSFFNDNDLDFEEETTIRREISTTGKSRAFINDTPVNLQILKTFSGFLMDIHSQHETLQIKDNSFQIKVLDSFIGITETVSDYTNKYHKYLKLDQKIKQLLNKEAESKSDLDYIEFQIDEISSLNLITNEKALLEEQLEIINNAEEIKQVLHQSSYTLLNSEHNLLAELKTILNGLSKISHCSENYHQLKERLKSIFIELGDLSREIDLLNDESGSDLQDPEQINERLNKIYSLEQKHRVNGSDELLLLLSEMQSKLEGINTSEEKIKQYQDELKIKKGELNVQATEISKKRTAALSKFQKNITNNLKELGIPDALFEIKQSKLPELNEMGVDNIVFMFTANKGFKPLELSKVASGGELSRLMLTMKSILSQSNKISTLLFDEIDTGVSGDVADKMGEIMKQISNKIQVISITHLPQVAAKGDNHFKIYKTNNNGKTFAAIKKLTKNDRVEELAKMLSGKELSNAAIENARNLITN